MSRPTRFPNIAKLLGAAAITTPIVAQDDHDDDAGAGSTIDAAALENAVSAEVAAATKKATAEANERWNAVMTSDAGKANPTAAARMLMKTDMAAADVIETIGDFGKPDAKVERDSAGADADRLRGGKPAGKAGGATDTNIDTGGAGGSDRGGKGFDAAAHRKRTADERNARATQAAGGARNTRQAG